MRMIENWELLLWKVPWEARDIQPSHQGGSTEAPFDYNV